MKAIRRTRRLLWELALLAAVAAAALAFARFGFGRYYERAYPMDYAALIDAACEERGLDRALVYAVVRTESGFRAHAESEVGARGLMQLMPDAYDWVRMRTGAGEGPVDYDSLFDPETNIACGTAMLRLLLDEFETVENALAAYHAGWGSVKEWLRNPDYAPDGKNLAHIPFEDTRGYVAKVKRTMDVYRKLYDL